VTLLDAERQHAPESPQGPPADPSTTPAGSVSPCPSCGAEMVPGQDWCLSCGHAAPGSLGEKSGWRAFSTISIVVLVLVLGAAAAAYAALSSHKRAPAIAAAPPAQVAQTPPAAAPPTSSTPAATPPATKPKPSKTLPKVTAPSSTAPGGTAVTPAPTTAPKTSTPPVSAPRTTTPSPGGGSTTTPKSTAPAAPVLIKLDPSAGSTYDPYNKTAAKGDPAKALDGDTSTSWYIDPSTTDGPIGAGYAIDLGSERSVKRIELTTTTPGFRVEVYASDVSPAPPDITDTRWSHITNVSKVGSGGGTQTIVVGGGTTKYQSVLLWITDRPTDGSRVRISELKVFG
jgi:hypothetical protein